MSTLTQHLVLYSSDQPVELPPGETDPPAVWYFDLPEYVCESPKHRPVLQFRLSTSMGMGDGHIKVEINPGKPGGVELQAFAWYTFTPVTRHLVLPGDALRPTRGDAPAKLVKRTDPNGIYENELRLSTEGIDTYPLMFDLLIVYQHESEH